MMIKLKDVSKYYYQDGVIASGFTKVNLDFHIGEFVVITGESGSGKSSLLNVISGLDSYEEGEMYINGEETSHYEESDYLLYRQKYVTNIFQTFNLVNSYTVYQNIELALLINGKSRKEVKGRVLELIKEVGLTKFKNTLASKLSGGQKQRVAIARALAYDTPIIVADEPTASLDSKQSKSILELLHKISENKLVIVVTHNKEEVEEYATRLIRMHDGAVIENKYITKINKDKDAIEKKIHDINLGSKIRLGVRNTFNLPIKFMLLFFVFFFVSMALINEYASMEQQKYNETLNGYNNFFSNTDEKRIVIKNKDNSVLTNEDLDKIKKLDNIDSILENDLATDITMDLYDNNNFYLYGNFKPLNGIKSVDKGRLPENENEIVVKGNKDDYYLTQDGIFNPLFTLQNDNNGSILMNNLKIVGIVYTDDYSYKQDFIVTDELMQNLSNKIIKENSLTELKINNNNISVSEVEKMHSLIVSDKVSDGEILISSDMSSYCQNYNCLNEFVDVKVTNLYYKNDLKLRVKNIYNGDNFKSLTGLENYENLKNALFISQNDYNKLYLKDSYQASVFVKNPKTVLETEKEISNLGFKTLSMKSALYDEAAMINQIFSIIKLVVMAVVLVTLFFISYFVVRIILKSRNSYFATIRSLGASKKVSRELLIIELISVATLAFGASLLLLKLVNMGVIKSLTIKEMISFVNWNDYLLMFILIILMALLISLRYSRKLFKSSIIKNYGEKI